MLPIRGQNFENSTRMEESASSGNLDVDVANTKGVAMIAIYN